MQPLCSHLATLAVALIFYTYRAHFQERLRRRRVLGARVAYLLYCVAQRGEIAKTE